jgi:hypothetical protein
MRTTVDLDQHLLKRLRIEARRRGISIKELLDTVLRRGLGERESAAGPSPRYRCPTFRMGSPTVGVNIDKALRLSAALEDEETLVDLARRK